MRRIVDKRIFTVKEGLMELFLIRYGQVFAREFPVG